MERVNKSITKSSIEVVREVLSMFTLSQRTQQVSHQRSLTHFIICIIVA